MPTPTKAEMIAFFQTYRAHSASRAVDGKFVRIASDSASMVSGNILTQARRASRNTPVRSATTRNLRPLQTKREPSSVPEVGGSTLLPEKVVPYTTTLVLDVDETLVHSSFKRGAPHDIALPIQVNGQEATVYVKIRPYLYEFLQFVAERFEVVIFTASLGLYCNALMDTIDPEGKLGGHRLFREHCVRWNGAYVKDLRQLGRNIDNVAIIDNSPAAYLFQPKNAIPITSWFDDADDCELKSLMPFLEQLAQCDAVQDPIEKHNASISP